MLCVMLTVAIKLDINIIAMLTGVQMSCLDCPTDAEVAWEVKDVEPMLTAKLECAISGPVVYDYVVITCGNDILDNREDGVLLVVGGYDDKRLRGSPSPDESTGRILAVASCQCANILCAPSSRYVCESFEGRGSEKWERFAY